MFSNISYHGNVLSQIVLPFISFVLLGIDFKEKTKVYNFHNFSANCCNYLRLNSINDDTKSFWNAKLGLYKYHSLDKNGSVIYKHTTEEDTYLYRSPLGNWLVGFDMNKRYLSKVEFDFSMDIFYQNFFFFLN